MLNEVKHLLCLSCWTKWSIYYAICLFTNRSFVPQDDKLFRLQIYAKSW